MKLSEQVVSLELAKKLKELGYPQESLWYWNSNGEIRRVDGFFDDDSKFIAVAPTVAELGEKLPMFTKSWNRGPHWICSESVSGNKWVTGEDIEANARAKMLIWLVENGHLKFN